MSENIEKAKSLLKRMDELLKDYSFDASPISVRSVGYMNPSFSSLKTLKRKRKKKGEKYIQ